MGALSLFVSVWRGGGEGIHISLAAIFEGIHIAELRELSKRKKEERCKRGIHDSSPDRSVMVPLSKKAMVSTPPKARICLAKKFQHIAPKPPPTATTTSEPSEEHLVMTGTGNESVETVTTTKMKPRVLPKFLQPRRNEGADVLTHFGLHAKVNLNLLKTFWKHIKKPIVFISAGFNF